MSLRGRKLLVSISVSSVLFFVGVGRHGKVKTALTLRIRYVILFFLSWSYSLRTIIDYTREGKSYTD